MNVWNHLGVAMSQTSMNFTYLACLIGQILLREPGCLLGIYLAEPITHGVLAL